MIQFLRNKTLKCKNLLAQNLTSFTVPMANIAFNVPGVHLKRSTPGDRHLTNCFSYNVFVFYNGTITSPELFNNNKNLL